jgi:hypothetical protein
MSSGGIMATVSSSLMLLWCFARKPHAVELIFFFWFALKRAKYRFKHKFQLAAPNLLGRLCWRVVERLLSGRVHNLAHKSKHFLLGAITHHEPRAIFNTTIVALLQRLL